jgi:predicted DsbA family dithiol-disulfide isomerase
VTASSSATLPAPSGTASRSATPTGRVEVWSDIACPWCYIGMRRFTAALQAFAHRDHVEVVWRSSELSPDTPVGPGVPEIAAADGLTYDFDRALEAAWQEANPLAPLPGTDETAGACVDDSCVI